MLAISESPRVRDGTVRKGSVVRILEFTCSSILFRRIIIVMKLDVLQSEHDIIGNSKIYDPNLLASAVQVNTGTYSSGRANQIAWKIVAEMTNVLGCLVKPELVIVKATLSIMNTESLCYAACPMVVNGRQCCQEVASNGGGWWRCNRCNLTFVACDYRYMISVQLEDSTGEMHATASEEVGKDIFGCTAKELYLMKYEKQDHAQFDKIVRGVQFREYLFKAKLNPEALSDKNIPECTIVGVETVNPTAESHRLL
ncbi:hypothetical protein BS78_K240200, partial [Paspalum vaginatum]